ncbi:tetratricopeptide repeat protein [Actinosynnema sp. NPDC023658]|uniref:tetratricopeptide repeat protein n=1 Tax=Actinosynnema sp. NPDC023658 TaxID=3155465 RepID=UPI0033F8EAD9
MFEVFVNYRTADARFGAAAVYELLAARFGTAHVFLDHRSMDPGAIYPAGLRAGVDQARVLLVLIGPGWLAEDPAASGNRLIDRENDWVRREIRRAIDRDIHIIPVLLDGVLPPEPGTLPADVDGLTLRQWATVDHRRLGEDVRRLASTLAALVPELDLPDLFVEQPPLPASPLPSELLNPVHRVVEYEDVHGSLHRLVDWLSEPAETDVRLFTGPGGSGKTRLAVELIKQAVGVGYRAGVVREAAPADALSRISAVTAPLLLVVDYAEARSEQVAELTSRVFLRPAPTRFLLLARSAGLWLRDLRRHQDIRVATLYEEVFEERVPPLVVDRRREWFEHAEIAFRAALLRNDIAVEPPEDIDGDHYDRALDVHAAALASVLDGSVSDMPVRADPVRRVLDHEERYWAAAAARHGLRPHPERLGEVVAAATLVGADSIRAARAVLGALSTLDRGSAADHLTWLGELYPGPSVLNPLRPDRLGEDLVAMTLSPENNPGLAAELAPVIGEAQLIQALTVLARAVVRHPHLRDAMVNLLAPDPAARVVIGMAVATQTDDPVLVDVLAELGYAPEVSAAVVAEMPESSLTLLGFAAAHTAALLHFESRKPNADPRLVAALRQNLAVRLTDAGDDDRALQEAISAVTTYRGVVASPDSDHEDLKNLSESLVTLAGAYSRTGLPWDAERAAAEALTLAESLPDPDEIGVIRALQAVASTHQELGALEQATETVTRAVNLVRALPADPDDDHTAVLGAVLEQACLIALGCYDLPTAARLAQEALDLYRDLDADASDRFRDDVVRMLGTSAGVHAELGSWEQGIALGEEAVTTARQLVGRYGDAHLTRLADALVNTAALLRRVGRFEDALTYLAEAVPLRQALADRLPGDQLADFANALFNLGNLMVDLDRPQDALDSYEQALDLHPKLPVPRKEEFASLLIARARVLVREDRSDEAEELIAEAVRVLEGVARGARVGAKVTLADALQFAAETAFELGRTPDALRDGERSVALYRDVPPTSSRDRDRKLALALHTWAKALDDVSAGSAWDTYAEAIDRLRVVPHAEDDLAGVLIDACVCAAERGDHWHAVELADEAVRLCRTAGEGGSRELEALNNLADSLCEVGEWDRAKEQADAALLLSRERGSTPVLTIAILLTSARVAGHRSRVEAVRLVRRAWVTAGNDQGMRAVVREQASRLGIRASDFTRNRTIDPMATE